VAKRAKAKTVHPEDDPIFGHLCVSFLSILSKVNPSVVILENVEPYLSSASMAIIRTQLKDMGYNVHERILDASAWNCLEARVRMCMVAVTEGIEFDFEKLLVPQKKERRLGEILDEVSPDDLCWRPYDYLKSKEVRDAEKGNSFNMQLFDENSSSIGTLRKGYHKGGSTDPLLRHPTNPDLLRQVNAFEHARCKEIPEVLITGMSKTSAHELLGQSVAHPPFVSVGELVGSTLKNWVNAGASFNKMLTEIQSVPQMDLLAA
jgi:DNA (cytosine-5)-methyltransferase 1